MEMKPLRRQGAPAPFSDPDLTLDGEQRALVRFRTLETLWFNTGTVCNIECAHCYIESGPRNDRIAYLTVADVLPYLDEIRSLGYPTREIAFTGGEPFMNPDMTAMAGLCLGRQFELLILTNAMKPMQRPRVKDDLLDLNNAYGDRLKLRVSIDHFTEARNDQERGAGSFGSTLEGLSWLVSNSFGVAIAGRTCFGEDEATLREGYARLFRENGIPLDANDPADLILFPEMDARARVPEITAACWGILDVSPDAMMCASGRMVVKRKGATETTVLPCTLLPYDPAFEMGASLSAAATADGGNFDRGSVKLNHPHCAKFCVLGGGSCSQ
jgi:uncharacterized Fe-S cluster-containing radical SAM superfamily protein